MTKWELSTLSRMRSGTPTEHTRSWNLAPAQKFRLFPSAAPPVGGLGAAERGNYA